MHVEHDDSIAIKETFESICDFIDFPVLLNDLECAFRVQKVLQDEVNEALAQETVNSQVTVHHLCSFLYLLECSRQLLQGQEGFLNFPHIFIVLFLREKEVHCFRHQLPKLQTHWRITWGNKGSQIIMDGGRGLLLRDCLLNTR